MQDGNYSVYKHTGPTGRIYIGITKQNPRARWQNGKGYIANARFMNAINKYGWDSFEHEIVVSGLSKCEAEEIEIELIAFYDSANPEFGYNIALGGSANEFTNDTKQKIRRTVRNRAVPVICVDTNEKFYSVIDAANKYKIAHQNIIKVCRGQRASAGGHVWQYAEG